MASLGSSIVYGILRVTNFINTKELRIDGEKQPKTTVSSTAPSSPQTNDIWIDTSS